MGSDGMPPWLPRLLRQVVVLIILFLAGMVVARELRGLIILILISFFLATALEPGVTYLANRGWRRGAAAGVIFLIFVLGAATFVALMIPLIVDQTVKLIDQLPSYVDQLGEFAGDFGIELSSDRLSEALVSIDSSLQDVATDVAGSLFGVGTRLLNTTFQLLTIGLFTFYITAEGPKLRRAVLTVLPPERQVEVLRILEIAIEKTGGYFYSRALLAVVASVTTWAVLAIVGVPFALPLGIWVGVLSQFVPVVGTYLGGILPVVIALLESPAKAVAVIVFIVLYQQFENYVISPRITARTMSLHPAIAFGAAIAGATLLGAAGALMALPVAATIQAFVSTYLERHQLVESHLLDEPSPVPSAKGSQGSDDA